MAGTPAFKFEWKAGGLDMKLPREALDRVFTPALQKRVVRVIRRGKDSLAVQYGRQTTIGFGGNVKWPKSKPFGSKEAPAKSLVSTGALKAAWLGEGPGSLERVSSDGNELTVGVDTGVLVYAGIHQSATATVVKANPANRSPGGQLKMFWALFFKYGLRISEEKLLAGFTIPPRRLALNDGIMSRVGEMVWAAILARGLIRLPTEPES